jgi:hypothetical protein
MSFLADRRALDQTVGNLLILMVTLSAISLALTVISPILAQYTSRNQIREAEALMTSLYNEIQKVEDEPIGSRRILEIEIKEGGIELLNEPPRMVFHFEVRKEVDVEITGMDFAYTARGAMLRKNMTLPFLEKVNVTFHNETHSFLVEEVQPFIGPGSNLIYISKTQTGKMNVTTVVYGTEPG